MTANQIDPLIETDLVNPLDNGFITDVIPPEMADSMRKCSSEVLCMDEDEIRKFKRITPTVEKLRIAFWEEYTKSVREERPINAIDIYRTVCSKMQYKMVISDPHRLTYMLKPPMTIINEQKALLLKSHREMWEVMDFPIIQDELLKNGKTRRSINLQLAKLKFEITKFLDERLQGAPVQRTLTINKNIDSKTPEEEEAEIQKLIEKEKQKMGF